MKPSPRQSAFTLIELLVVMAIIGILASMILASVVKAKTNALRTRARLEMASIGTAISGYETKYGRLPIVPGLSTGVNDVTFGWNEAGSSPTTVIPNNAALIAILMDEVSYGNGQPTPNQGHMLNLQREIFLNAKKTSDPDAPGIGPDGEYRDPWGQPYVISLDYSLNDRCRDAVYSRATVSQKSGQTGLNGLFNPIPAGASDDYEHGGHFLIWSKGQDKQAFNSKKANVEENKNNLLSWQ